MSLLGDGGNCGEVSTYKECKRDFDGELQRLNSRIDSVRELSVNMIKVANSTQLYNVSDHSSRRELSMIFGSVVLEEERLFQQWEDLIKQIEEEEK